MKTTLGTLLIQGACIAAISASFSTAFANDLPSQINLPAEGGDTVVDCVETSMPQAQKAREFWIYYSHDKLVSLEGALGSYYPGTVPGKPGYGFSIEAVETSSSEDVYRFGFDAPGLLGGDGAEHRYGYGEIHIDLNQAGHTQVTGAEYSRHGLLNLKHKVATYAGTFSCTVVHPSLVFQDCVARLGGDALDTLMTNECQLLWDHESYRQSHLDTIRDFVNY